MLNILMAKEGLYGFYHLGYIILIIILIALSSIIFYKYRSEKFNIRVIKILAAILLVVILINRITVTYYNVVVFKKDGYTWLNLIPNTYCGLSSLVVSLSIIFGKKDNKVLQGIYPLGLIGGIITFFYPDFLVDQTFFDIRSLTGLLHHTLMAYTIIYAICTKYIVVSMKKFWYFPLTFCIVMTLGIFEKDALGFPSAMQISSPLLKSMPILTAWYVVVPFEIILYLIFIIIYEKITIKKN